MTFEEWKAAIIKRFNDAGEHWAGYGEEMLQSLGEAAAVVSFTEGITPDEMVEAEFDAAR